MPTKSLFPLHQAPTEVKKQLHSHQGTDAVSLPAKEAVHQTCHVPKGGSRGQVVQTCHPDRPEELGL